MAGSVGLVSSTSTGLENEAGGQGITRLRTTPQQRLRRRQNTALTSFDGAVASEWRAVLVRGGRRTYIPAQEPSKAPRGRARFSSEFRKIEGLHFWKENGDPDKIDDYAIDPVRI